MEAAQAQFVAQNEELKKELTEFIRLSGEYVEPAMEAMLRGEVRRASPPLASSAHSSGCPSARIPRRLCATH